MVILILCLICFILNLWLSWFREIVFYGLLKYGNNLMDGYGNGGCGMSESGDGGLMVFG